MALESAKAKLEGKFAFENLPADRSATALWDKIEAAYKLTLEELSALQNERCKPHQGDWSKLMEVVTSVKEDVTSVKEDVTSMKATISSRRESDSDSKSSGKRSRGSESGHHYAGQNRDKKAQAAMSAAVLKRDGRCLISGSGPEHALDCAHIVGLEHIDSFTRDKHYDPLMGFALRKDLHPSYDQHEWYFQKDGSVVRLRPGTIKLPDKIKLPELDHLAIAEKERIAINEAAARCPYCWRKVGASNVDTHRKTSCDDPEFAAKRPKPH